MTFNTGPKCPTEMKLSNLIWQMFSWGMNVCLLDELNHYSPYSQAWHSMESIICKCQFYLKSQQKEVKPIK